MKRIIPVITFVLCFLISAKAQYSSLNAHSHNDYQHDAPFYEAYTHRFGSIEADVWAVDGELLVAHHRSEVKPGRTIDSLYIHPIVASFRENGGRAWDDLPFSYQLLVDIKTEVEPALSLLIEKLKKYPDVFDPAVNENAVQIIISGNRPSPSCFKDYPEFISFDGRLNIRYNQDQLKRVPIYSENIKDFTGWNGETAIPEKEEERLKFLIDSVHHLNKKIRFWNAPDIVPAWKILEKLNADYINTDKIPELAGFLKNKN